MGFLSIIVLKDSGLGTAFFTFVLVIITGIYAYFTHQSVRISQDFLFFESQERIRQRIIEISKGVILPIQKNLKNSKWCIDAQFYFKMTDEKKLSFPIIEQKNISMEMYLLSLLKSIPAQKLIQKDIIVLQNIC